MYPSSFALYSYDKNLSQLWKDRSIEGILTETFFWRKSVYAEKESIENEYNGMRQKVLGEIKAAKKETEVINKVLKLNS